VGSKTDGDILLGLVEDVSLFKTEWGEAYADIEVEGHRETWPVASQEFKDRLLARFLRSEHRALSGPALNNVLAALRAKVVIGGETKPVFLRVADFGGKRYLDLANGRWEVVEISKAGWKIVADSPVRFHRVRGMAPLPRPGRGGKIQDLRPFLGNISDTGFVLVVGWLLTVLNGHSPYPVLVFWGVQGSAKSSASSYTRSVIDPALTPLGTLPSTKTEYSRAVSQNWVLAWDNVSQINNKTSDVLCRLSTGGYEPHYGATGGRPSTSHTRPIILNSIVPCVRRPDLADRALFVTLEPIKDKDRKQEGDLEAKFAKALPGVVGALLDALVVGLINSKSSRIEAVGRLVDMHQFVTGCGKAFSAEGSFGVAYQESQKLAASILTETSTVATGVIRLVEERGVFGGTSTDLLRELNARVRNVHVDGRLPGGPAALSSELERVKPLLAAQGILIDRDRTGQRGDRWIEISRLAPPKPKARARQSQPVKSKPTVQPPQGELPLDLPAPAAELEPA
jgi:hypothetical protein